MQVSEMRHLCGPAAENARLKNLIAEAKLDKALLKESCQKMVKPSGRKRLVDYFESHYDISERWACGTILCGNNGRALSPRRADRGSPSV